MMIAPDVFATGPDGTYTPQVAVDWIYTHGAASPLYLGRTLRHDPEVGWEYGPATADAKTVWKPLSEAPKTLRAAIGDPDGLPVIVEYFDPDRPAYYELIGPKIAKNPHRLDKPRIIRHGALTAQERPEFTGVPTTSLFGLARYWFAEHDHLGILWTWHDRDRHWPQHAVVRRDRLPQL